MVFKNTLLYLEISLVSLLLHLVFLPLTPFIFIFIKQESSFSKTFVDKNSQKVFQFKFDLNA